MSGILVSILAFCAAIALLVAVHELGHFAVARALGVKVLRFSIGFGKPIWRYRSRSGRHAGETEYVLSAIPLGGYVRLLDEREGAVPEAELNRAFNRQPVGSRMAVLAAGPLANFLFAFVAYWLMFVAGVPGARPIIGEVAAGSAAEAAGLESEDEIIAVDGERVATWESALLGLLEGLLDDGRIELTLRDGAGAERIAVLEAGGREAELTEPGALLDGLGFAPFEPELPAVIGEVVDGEAAARAGLEPGDRILSADGEPVAGWVQWVEFVRARPGQRVELAIERGGEPRMLELVIGSMPIDGTPRGRIGAAPAVPEGLADRLRAEQRYAPAAAAAAAVMRTWEMSALTLRMLWRMVLGDVSVKNISGPINIAQYAGYTASAGVAPFLNFLAIVSLSLGILNLMPIPLLDGGQLLYQLIELVKGSPVSERAQLFGQQIGIALLLLIMSFAFYNDISRLVG
ncbi:MAG TPA: RIP metalloprotease RseP [Gammaproteobacteria bacterium]|nr:RIP metalloprotease RseP [Gammaproteobacteria bacterium]